MQQSSKNASFTLDSLLMGLRYPRPGVPGMAVWGPDEGSGRTNAWVKWDGTTLSAHLSIRARNQPDATVTSLRIEVDPNGSVSSSSACDSHGEMEVAQALDRFRSIPLTEPVSFIAVPTPHSR